MGGDRARPPSQHSISRCADVRELACKLGKARPVCGVAAEKLRWGCQSNSLCEYCTYELEVGRAANLSTHSPQRRSRGRNTALRTSSVGPGRVCMSTAARTTGTRPEGSLEARGRLPSPTGSGIPPCASQLRDPRALIHKRIDVEPRLCLCATLAAECGDSREDVARADCDSGARVSALEIGLGRRQRRRTHEPSRVEN